MTDNYSRSQWDQIVTRVRKAKFFFDPRWKCFLCGKRFTHNACPHTLEANVSIIKEVQAA